MENSLKQGDDAAKIFDLRFYVWEIDKNQENNKFIWKLLK